MMNQLFPDPSPSGGAAAGVSAASGCWVSSNSATAILLCCQRRKDLGDAALHHEVDSAEIGGEGEHGYDYDGRGGANLSTTRPSDPAHLHLQVCEVVSGFIQPRLTLGGELFVFHRTSFLGYPTGMAGAEGFEPPKAVLETAGLPLAYAPNRHG